MELVDVNIESMVDFGYFIFGDNICIEFDFGILMDYWLEVVMVLLIDYWVMKLEDFEVIVEDVCLNGGMVLESVDFFELYFILFLKDLFDVVYLIMLDVYDLIYYVDFCFS